ncbi:hypothetical protein P376_0470 [Streptomyces sp. HCCB10043]|nr:hypothetical protein P376_0470 [Streptomyces sp. HCCB10043]
MRINWSRPIKLSRPLAVKGRPGGRSRGVAATPVRGCRAADSRPGSDAVTALRPPHE